MAARLQAREPPALQDADGDQDQNDGPNSQAQRTDGGRVTDAQVVRAAPSGYYEEQALAILRSRRFEDLAPGETGTEIIDFSIEQPADGSCGTRLG